MPKKYHQLTINVDEKLHWEVKKYALEKKTTVTKLILEFFEKLLSKKD